MRYEKRVVILSQIRSGFSVNREAAGIVKIERSGGEITCRTALFNLKNPGEMYIAVKCKGVAPARFSAAAHTTFTLDPSSDLSEIFCAVAPYGDTDGLPVLYGSTEGKAFSPQILSAFLANVTDGLDRHSAVYRQNPAPPLRHETGGAQPAPICPPTPPVPVLPDAAEEDIAAAAALLEQPEVFDLPETFGAGTEDTRSAAPEIDDEVIADANYYEFKDEPAEFIKSRAETVSLAPKKDCRYYREVKEELDQLFTDFPEDAELNALVGNGKFVRINYIGDKYYSVGLISHSERPLCICYAVPGEYSSEAPEELKGFCQWLPLSFSDYMGRGFWVMYQDADSGETVKDIIL